MIGLLLPSFKVKVEVFTVETFSASLKVTLREVFMATSVAPFVGLVLRTVGDMVSVVSSSPPSPFPALGIGHAE